MPRAPRLQIAGGLYHVTARGNRRQAIFHDVHDHAWFLELFDAVATRYGWTCHGYCLMPNHYHALVKVSEGNLSAGIQRLNGVYAQSFNHRHDLTGHLFQGRFHSASVESESHLLELTRYLVLNPVRGGLCGSPGEWPWSSYRAMVGVAAPLRCLDLKWLLDQFAIDDRVARRNFRRFVEAEPTPVV